MDGSIARVDRHATEATPIHAGEGGRVWELVVLGGPAEGAGVFVELDERGLTLHRLADDASIDLYVADNTALARWVGSATRFPGGYPQKQAVAARTPSVLGASRP